MKTPIVIVEKSINSLKIEKIKEESKWGLYTALSVGLNLTLLAVITGRERLFVAETYINYKNEHPVLTLIQVGLIIYPLLRTILVSTKYMVLSGD